MAGKRTLWGSWESVRRAALGLAVVGLLCGLPAAAQDRYQEASELLQKGLTRRAAKLFEEVAAEGGERQAVALIGAASAYNALGERDQAVAVAKRVLGVTDEPIPRTMAQREIARALSSGERNPDQQGDLEGAVEGLRTFLRRHPADPISDVLRRGLCEAVNAANLPRSAQGEPLPVVPPPGIQPPETVHNPKPQPSKDARRRLHVKSRALVEGVIDEDGCVSQVKVLDANEPFWAEIVERTFAGWVFRPATDGGRPVAILYQVSEDYTGGRGGRRR